MEKILQEELSKKGFDTKGKKTKFDKQNAEIDEKFKKIVSSKGVLK